MSRLDDAPHGPHLRRILACLFSCILVIMSTTCTKVFEPDPPSVRDIHMMPAWSPSGSRIAYTHVTYNTEHPGSLYVIRIHDVMTHADTIAAVGFRPDWSPDEKRLAYVRDGSIYHVDLETGQHTRLTEEDDYFFPSWSPQGDSIAYDSPYALSGIWIESVADVGRRQVVLGRMPAWSPDGRKLIFVSYSLNRWPYSEISQIDLKTGAVDTLTANATSDSNPSVSSDGAWIAWDGQGLDSSVISVYAMRANGTEVRRLVARGSDPFWLPDGEQLVYVAYSERRRGNTLWICARDGSGKRELIQLP